MAGEAAAEILSQKLEILLCHLECVRFLSTEKLVKDAKKKLATIQGFFSTQDRQSKSMERPLLRAMNDAEESMDKFHLREARGRHGALHVVTRPAATLISKYKLWRDLSNLVTKMQELTGKTEKEPASSSFPAGVSWKGQKKVRQMVFRNLQGRYFLCRKKEKKEIIELIGVLYSRSGVDSVSNVFSRSRVLL